eukprot:TRINITY_DN11385_c0_g1_i1.p1 TRINITY_DN11385_c0_g1~~TRINITY_DN11385_c0_g1_i1.p1  ORF type:complete len:203 (+),score=30.25 TRINITY_DN11385_c0_g1_i1:53-610(+)
MSRGCWERMMEFWSQFFHLVLILGLVGGLVILGVGWVVEVSERGFENPNVVHVLALGFGVVSVVLLLYSTFSKEGWSGSCTSFLLLTLLPLTYALLGATIGVNAYYADKDCYFTDDPDSESLEADNATAPAHGCNEAAIQAQFGGAAIAAISLFVHILAIQKQYRRVQKESEGQIRMHDIQGPTE